MSCIEKLQIQGFRSFSADDHDPGPQKIDFVRKAAGPSPLTLILGQNGCGKTTIIECLRYVTTGDCPPGSFSGRSFVHDPKMAREAVVTANVKLQFAGADGDKYIVSRSIEATQKAKVITVKTLDVTITRKKSSDGSFSTLSMKCADINTTIFNALGVSKPILNFVIFCHQEDSNWPLDEGSKVKDKFDEIFASARYKDCLKRVKDVRAEQKRLHIDLKKDIEYLSSDKKMADDKKRELRTKKANRDELRAKLDSIDEELEPIRVELMELNEVEKNFSGTQERITKAQTSLEHCRKEMNDLRRSINEIIPATTSDEKIEEMKLSLEGEEKVKRDKIADLLSDLRRLQKEKENCSAELERLTSKIGECRGMRAKFDRDKRDLRATLVRTGRALGWSSIDDSDVDGARSFASDAQVEEAVENIKDTLDALERQQCKTTDDFESKISDESSKVSRLEIQQAQLEEQKRMKTSEMIKMKREVATLKREMSDSQDSAARLETVSRQLEDKESELRQLKSTFDKDESSSTLKRLKQQLIESERLESDLKAERSKLDAQREISSEIAIKKADLTEKEEKMDRILAKNCRELGQVFEGDIIPGAASLKNEFNNRLEKLATRKNSTEKEIQKLKAETKSKRDVKKSLVEELQIKEDRLKTLDRKLEEVISADEEFDSVLSSAKADVDRARFELQAKEANKFTFQEFIEKIQQMQSSTRSKPCCPTCNRSFENDSAVKTVLDDLESEIQKIPSKVANLQAKLKRAVVKLDKLQAMLPDKKRADELRREVAEKKEQLTQYDREIKKNEEAVTEKEDILEVAEVDHSMAEAMREDVVTVDRLFADCSALRKRMAELNDQCPSLAGARDCDTVHRELEDVSRKLTSLRLEIDITQRREMDFEKRLNELERQKNVLANEKLGIERRHLERVKNETKRVELEAAVAANESAVTKIEEQLEPISRQIRDVIGERNKLTADRDRKLNALRAEMETVRKFQNQVAAIQKQISDYVNSNNETTMSKAQADQDKWQDRRKTIETRAEGLEAQKLELEEEVNQQANRKRHLDDNIRLRNYQKSEREYDAEYRRFAEKLERLDFASVKRKRNDLLSTYDKLEKSKSENRGRLSEMENGINALEKELDTDKLKNAEALHREKSVEERCRFHAINDLNKYYIALDWAIMRFHQERMSQINKIIRELWRATYKGNDIDYIEIKTDETESVGADKKRVCNYRVIMVKNDTEMEMRGRCSAGQKVLASLIIRLALAETFSSTLGMIALDEPTTNLDRENIESLADALCNLVTRHSHQQNFQLIIITHDEELIDHLCRVDQVDHFYKVSRNENGLSIIRKIKPSSR